MGCSSRQQLRQLDYTLDINSGLAYFTERRPRQYLPFPPILLLGTALGTVHKYSRYYQLRVLPNRELVEFRVQHAFLTHGTREPIE
jgi:hypothetical protein